MKKMGITNKIRGTFILILISLLVFTACEPVPGSSRYSSSTQIDEKPDVCTSTQENRIIREAQNDWDDSYDLYMDARDDYLDAHNDTLEGFTLTAPAGFVEPTGFDVTTHILIYEGPNTNTLYRDQSFNIQINPIDVGTAQTVTTVDAKASVQLRHDFDSLNEVEIIVTPNVNSSFVAKEKKYRKFIPCEDTWFIKIPYELTENTTASLADVPELTFQNWIDQKITVTNPLAIEIDSVEPVTFYLSSGKSNRYIFFEYQVLEIKTLEILDKDGKLIPSTTFMPENESIDTINAREFGFGPLTKSGDYTVNIFSSAVNQPITPIVAKIYDGEEVYKAGDLYIGAKASAVARQFIEDNNIAIAFALIVFVLLFFGGRLKNGK